MYKHFKSGAVDEHEARLRAVKEFMINEMKVSDEVIEEMIIEKVFPPARADWNTLYVKFYSESSVHKLYSHARNMRADLRLVPYIPKQFYNRYKELETQAYELRHCEERYRTKVTMGISDLLLYKKTPLERSWKIHINSSSKMSQGSLGKQIQSTNSHQLNLRPNSGFLSVSQKYRNRE